MSATITNRRRHRYGIVEERTLEDPRLGCVARTIAAWLQVKADGWTISVDHLQYRLGLGVSAWRTASRELRDAGYLVTARERGERGRWEWDIDFAVPDQIPPPDRKHKRKTMREKSIDGQPNDGAQEVQETRVAQADRPSTHDQNSADGGLVDGQAAGGQPVDITLPTESPTETLLGNTTTHACATDVVVIESKAAAHRDLLELAFADLQPEQQQLLADTLEHRLRSPIDPPGSIARWIGTVKKALLGQGENPFDGSGAREIATRRNRAKIIAEGLERSKAHVPSAVSTEVARSTNPAAMAQMQEFLKATNLGKPERGRRA